MVLLRERVHPRGLSLAMQRKVYVRRTVHKEPWETIAAKVKNLEGDVPYWQVCRDAFNRLTEADVPNGYSNCGRHAEITPALRKWLVSRLRALRQKTVCTSEVLQRQLAQHKGVVVEASTVRRHLKIAGYRYLKRGKKRKYTKDQRAARKGFTDWVNSLTLAELKRVIDFSLDGVVLTVPPEGVEARENFLHTDDLFVWRKPSERDLPELAGFDHYNNQVPKKRMLPLWGGIGWGRDSRPIPNSRGRVWFWGLLPGTGLERAPLL